jgi:uncharacterized protein (UPF0303 family)
MAKYLSLTLVFALLMVSAREGIAQSTDEAMAWQTVAQKLDAGVTVDVRLRDSQHFKATFIAARPDAIVVQRKSRVPVGIETIAYESVASLARVDPAGLSRGKVAGIAFGAAGATVGTLLLFISLLAYD